VVVVQAVEHLASMALADDEPHVTQDAKLVRDGGLGHRDELDDLPDGPRAVTQAAEDMHPARGGKRMHHLRHPLGHRTADGGPPRFARYAVAHGYELTGARCSRSGVCDASRNLRRERHDICANVHAMIRGVSSTTPALLAAAAGVGLGHAILPDHWVPLAVVGRTQRYSLARVARLSLLAGTAHVLVSLLLGAIIVVIGLQFRSTVESAQNTIIGVVLMLTGIGFAALELTGRGHGHDDGTSPADGDRQAHGDHHPHLHTPPESDAIVLAEGSRVSGIASIMVPFGAAASPDLTILPVFLAATAAGAFTAAGALIVFSTVTIVTIVGLTLLACFGGYQVRGQWLERWGNVLTAAVLVLIGALVLTGIV
jgi:nickel/cobalt transporter (NicO) family protein